MAKLSHRIFALTFAILFFVVASATSVFVIYDVISSHKKQTNNASSQSQTPDANKLASCQQSTKQEAVLPAPESYTQASVTSLEIKDLSAGKGAAAKKGDCLVMKYYGTLATTGQLFDENYTKPTGFTFLLGQGQVIPGWDAGLVGMKVGGERRLVIPSSQAYGNQAQGDKIPANSNLVFVVRLLRIQS